ncbi:predicted protein [Naegleria gruberi]|uniref:Predicted protein n=1 Tax=Naegleria gruberi TaxID=5762 RepID=D2VRC7_NAEGR|nr:uncharacterized protein NAEGRDRAFT_71539 [Naegleria gruberi]EFC40584.1 predicted protein [Naegleria gruberi]|eukprot:XP_002673328.1 predicted protein [Naegleria gruberi strain NEG-M]
MSSVANHHKRGGANSNGKRGLNMTTTRINQQKEINDGEGMRDDSSLINQKLQNSSNDNNNSEREKETIVNSDRLRLLLFNHKSRNTIYNNSLNKQQVTVKNLVHVGVEQQPAKKYNHSQSEKSDNCFDEGNQEKINSTVEEMNSIIKPKWLKSIVDNQCDLGFVKENGNCTNMNHYPKIRENNSFMDTKSKKVSKESINVKKKNGSNRKIERTEKSFNNVMLELFKERSTEIQPPQDIQSNDTMFTKLTKSWNRFLFWWIKWKRDFTTNTIHQFLSSYDPVMRTFECVFIFFETFRIPYPIRYAVHRIRHFLYLIFQFVWTSTFLFEENSEFERELLSHNNRRNDSQIYNADPRYYYDDVNYYSQN